MLTPAQWQQAGSYGTTPLKTLGLGYLTAEEHLCVSPTPPWEAFLQESPAWTLLCCFLSSTAQFFMALRSPPALSIPQALLVHVNTFPLPSCLPGSAATFHLILKPFNSSVIPSLSPVIHFAHSCRDMSPCSPLSLGSADIKGVLHPHVCRQGNVSDSLPGHLCSPPVSPCSCTSS